MCAVAGCIPKVGVCMIPRLSLPIRGVEPRRLSMGEARVGFSDDLAIARAEQAEARRRAEWFKAAHGTRLTQCGFGPRVSGRSWSERPFH